MSALHVDFSFPSRRDDSYDPIDPSPGTGSQGGLRARRILRMALPAALMLAASCVASDLSTSSPPQPATSTSAAPEVPTTTIRVSTTLGPRETTSTTSGLERPLWLGTRILPLLPDGTAQVLPTPPELIDRRIPTPDHLPSPAGDTFESTVGPVPLEVAERSTWQDSCPLPLEQLSYLRVSFFGFDGRFHNGEMIVEAVLAHDVVEVFRQLHEQRFPIEEMRVISKNDLEHAPTGDGNVTTSFVCRPVVFGSSWSEHAYGRAIDINPFHNPYRKGERVIPELASAYLDRVNVRPGMIVAGDVVTEAFAAIGWGWGGDWRSTDDWMHFSVTGR